MKSETPILGVVLTLMVFVLIAEAQASGPDSHGKIRLLHGYVIREQHAVDALAWTIENKATGLEIDFEAGPSQGPWADRNDISRYSWFKEQVTLSGDRVFLALIKPGQVTQWEPDNRRGHPPGSILLVTFPIGSADSTFTANFRAKVTTQEELTDVLLMVMTFDPGFLKGDIAGPDCDKSMRPQIPTERTGN